MRTYTCQVGYDGNGREQDGEDSKDHATPVQIADHTDDLIHAGRNLVMVEQVEGRYMLMFARNVDVAVSCVDDAS